MAKKKAVKAKADAAKVKKKAAGTARKVAKKTGKSAQKVASRKQPSAQPSLGRPLVTGEELLFMLFKEDYHARQIFDFLRVERVKELEAFSPDEIVKILSQPITETVNRIRRKLAEKHRSLKNDATFALASRSSEAP